MDSNFSVLFKKYSVPFLFTALGLAVVVMGLTTKQNAMFMVAGGLMLFAGVLSILYSSGKLSVGMLKVLSLVAAIGGIAAVAISWKQVSETQKHNELYALTVLKSQENLSDIRSIQREFATQKGRYARTWDELEEFARDAKTNIVDAKGTVPGRRITEAERDYIYRDNRAINNFMTEEEAWILSKSPICPDDLKGFRRDTIAVDFLKLKFGSDVSKQARELQKLGPWSLDSLRYIPWTGKKETWKLETRDSVNLGDRFVPAFMASGKYPVPQKQGGKRDEIFIGNLSTGDLGGSWE